MMRYVKAISVTVGIVLILAAGVSLFCGGRSDGAKVSIVPLGRATGVAGAPRFMVAVTNNTLFTRSLVVGRNKVFEIGQGYTTNFMSIHSLRLGPRSGLVVAVEPPTNSGPWLLGVGHRRAVGAAEWRIRVLATKLNIFKEETAYGGWPVEYIEVEK